MKKRILIIVMLGLTITLSVFYACKKTENQSQTLNSTKQNAQISERSAGVVTYYSKATNNTVYKMILTTDANGVVSIDRSIYSTSRADTIKTKVYVGENVHFTEGIYKSNPNSQYSDTTYVNVPANTVYYIIPFIPGGDPVSRTIQTKYYCQCGCSDCANYGIYGCMKNGDDYSRECIGVCDDCKAIADGCPSSLRVVPDVGGHVIIEASSYNVIN